MADLDEIIKDNNWIHSIKTMWNPLFSRGRYTYNRFLDETTGEPIITYDEYRIHSSIWHYEGIVHE